MVKIKEHQYELGNPDNFQEREIEYSSWDKYKEGLKNHKQWELAYPSIPRNAAIDYIFYEDDTVFIFTFFNWNVGYVIHKAELLDKEDEND